MKLKTWNELMKKPLNKSIYNVGLKEGKEKGITETRKQFKCTGCGEIPTLCDKCNQEICSEGQDSVAEQVRTETNAKWKQAVQRFEERFVNSSAFSYSYSQIKEFIKETFGELTQ